MVTNESDERLAQAKEDTEEERFRTDRLLTVDEVGERLGMGRSSVYKLMEEGKLRSVKLGSLRRIWDKDVRELILKLMAE